MNRGPHDIAASVRQRLLNLSRERYEAFLMLLNRYGSERLLYRLSQSPYRDRFILKGATLLSLWTGRTYRPTRDLDFLGQGDDSPARLEAVFRDICRVSVEADGLSFLPDSVIGAATREGAVYGGVRVKLLAMLGKTRISLQVDIGMGDAVTPAALQTEIPVLLDFPAPHLRVCPRETVVAEKFQAMVALGLPNSRMKDFYDLWILSREFGFDGATLTAAIRATFARRRTAVPGEPPLALTARFSEDESKRRQWEAFLRKGMLDKDCPSLEEMIAALSRFLMPPVEALIEERTFDRIWLAGDQWRDVTNSAGIEGEGRS